MEHTEIDRQIAARLKDLRLGRGWSLDDLAQRSGVSRATLSRLENAEVSASASVLGRLCSVHGLTMSRLMQMVEEDHAPLVRRRDRQVWRDPETGLIRQSISPPARGLAGEVLECELPAQAEVTYAAPARERLEHHLVMLRGKLDLTVGDTEYRLTEGDCLRYQLHGASIFRTAGITPARYLLFMV